MTLLNENSDWAKTKNPLIISSSGGSGHLIAAHSLIEQLQLHRDSLTQHPNLAPSQFTLPLERILCKLSEYYHHPHFGKLLAKISPVELPHPRLIQRELARLQNQQKSLRPYIDYMLDLQPEGFILTALFNLSQQRAHGPSLHHLTYHQNILDKYSKSQVQKKLTRILISALENGKPYDLILMTQPMGLECIAETMFNYNKNIPQMEKKYQVKIPKLYLHQFLTDIPTTKAFHYLRPLHKLKPLYRKHLVLHSMDLLNIPSGMQGISDAPIFFYPPKKLPIIRQAFKQNQNQTRLQPGLVTLMLSSANGDLSIEYLQELLKLPFQKFNLIGELSAKHQKLVHNLPKNSKQSIHLCGFLQAKELANTLAASSCIVLKAGGMSLMELAALECCKDRIICLHQNHQAGDLSLSWEDGNYTWFKSYCKTRQQEVIDCHPGNLHKKLKPLLMKFEDVASQDKSSFPESQGSTRVYRD